MADTHADQRAWHQCYCVYADNRSGEVRYTPCNALVPPDSPFCLSCEDRHPETAYMKGVVTTTRPL